jgi:cell division protein FtsI/penicillin-binding protein 2
MTRYPGPILPSHRPIWKDRQSYFKKAEIRNKIYRSGIKFAFFISLCFVATYGLFNWLSSGGVQEPERADSSLGKGLHSNDHQTDPAYIRRLVKNQVLINLPEDRIHFTKDGETITIQTSINIPLQNYLLKKMDRRNSRHIGVVVLEPSSGKVVTMAGFDKQDPLHNTCLDNRFPAASIFKIVTAAAAVEQCGLNSNSTLRFNGNQHTLYKTQLKDRSNKFTNTISFRDSFAKSVNPVFGKIGTLKLGKESLQKYAEAFGFNMEIDFEKPLLPSRLTISDDPYNWAEIASGFNRNTTLSPLHGALLAAIVLQEGKRIDPSIIEKITIDAGRTIYQDRSNRGEQVISPATSRVIYDLMEATIRYGTSSKAFRGYQKDPVLSKLNIGGKTGSIYNDSHEIRYDWFVGFADVKNGKRQLAVAVVVGHEKYIGVRASQYARMAMEKYFTDYFNTDLAKTYVEHSG